MKNNFVRDTISVMDDITLFSMLIKLQEKHFESQDLSFDSQDLSFICVQNKKKKDGSIKITLLRS